MVSSINKDACDILEDVLQLTRTDFEIQPYLLEPDCMV